MTIMMPMHTMPTIPIMMNMHIMMQMPTVTACTS